MSVGDGVGLAIVGEVVGNADGEALAGAVMHLAMLRGLDLYLLKRLQRKRIFQNIPWVIMLTVTILQFTTLAMKGGAYVYYFENYVLSGM